MQPKAAGQSFKSANDLTLEKGNRLTLEKGNQVTLEKGNQLTLEKGSQLTLEKGNQLTLDKGNKLTLETGSQSLPAPANPWERDRANSSSSQDLMPGPRTVATLGPPEGYWESFHQEWLQNLPLEGNLSSLSEMKTTGCTAACFWSLSHACSL